MPTERLLRIVESRDTSTHFAASARAVEHGACDPQSVDICPGVPPLLQHADHGLGVRQAAGTQKNDDPVAGALEHRHFTKLCEIVDFGMGARVGRENHPRVEDSADAGGQFGLLLTVSAGLDRGLMIAAVLCVAALRDGAGPLARLSAPMSHLGVHWHSLPPSDRVLTAIANPVSLPDADKRGLASEAPAHPVTFRCRLADLGIFHTDHIGIEEPNCEWSVTRNTGSLSDALSARAWFSSQTSAYYKLDGILINADINNASSIYTEQ